MLEDKLENWAACAFAGVTENYINACELAVNNDDAFNNFKRDGRYQVILEHVSPEFGKFYAEEIKKYKINNDLINLFKENDSIGGANILDYGDPFGKISPSTLRYIKNSLDISSFCGESSLNKVVEIGGGYGGLCKTISCLINFNEYHIYDIEPALKLTKKYLSKFDNIHSDLIYHSEPTELKDIDLLISNYAYSELSEELQNLYYNNVIKNSKKVYMIMNNLSDHVWQLSRQDFIKKAEQHFNITFEECPDFLPNSPTLYFVKMTAK